MDLQAASEMRSPQELNDYHSWLHYTGWDFVRSIPEGYWGESRICRYCSARLIHYFTKKGDRDITYYYPDYNGNDMVVWDTGFVLEDEP